MFVTHENFVATVTTNTSTMIILLKFGVILGMKNKPITATTTATIATFTTTPPTSKIAVEEFYNEDIVEYEDEDEELIGMVIEFPNQMGQLLRKEKKSYDEVQPKVPLLSSQQKQAF